MPPPRENAYNLGVRDQTKNLKGTYKTRTNAENFVKILQTSRPWSTYFWPKFVFLQFWGLYSHISAPINVKFGTIGATCRRCGAKNPFLDLWVKTIPAWLRYVRTGLPVIKSYSITTGLEHTTYAIKPEHLVHWAMAAVGDIGLMVQYKIAHVRYTPARA